MLGCAAIVTTRLVVAALGYGYITRIRVTRAVPDATKARVEAALPAPAFADRAFDHDGSLWI